MTGNHFAIRIHATVRMLLVTSTVLAGCADSGSNDPRIPDDVAEALAAMPEARVLEWTQDGLPKYIVGEMGKVGAMQSDDPIASDAALRPGIVPVLKPFRLAPADLTLRKMNIDEEGGRHFRYVQVFNGLPVIGGDLVVHVDVNGA